MCAAAQLVPLPAVVAGVLSPHWFALRSALSLTPGATFTIRPLSIRATDTEWALAVSAGAIAAFFFARASYARGGVRRTLRALGITGFVVSCLAIAQATTGGRHIYWLFATSGAGPLPFGPFVNRNHFSTWVIMALPVTVGYLAAHLELEEKKAPLPITPRARMQYVIDQRAAWLTVCAGFMLLALLLSVSRCGSLALAGSGAVAIFLTGRHISRDRRVFLLGTAALLVCVAFGPAEIDTTANRVGGASAELTGRLAIWRETLPVIRDFWLTGTGAGTYRTAMMVYQQSDRAVSFNQAQNHFLQIAAEGGLLLVVPFALGLRAFVRSGVAALSRDRTPVLWIRAGAACGLGAVALQCLWETGLVLPANAFLAAVLAALLLHEDCRQQDDHRTN